MALLSPCLNAGTINPSHHTVSLLTLPNLHDGKVDRQLLRCGGTIAQRMYPRNPDSVVTDANTGGSFNRYAYAANNSFKYVDPDGRAIERHRVAFPHPEHDTNRVRTRYE